jgi:hypothetical protein
VKILTVKSKFTYFLVEKEIQNALEYAATRLPKLVRLEVGGRAIRDKNLIRSLLRLEHLRHLNVDVAYEALGQEFNHISPSILTLQLDSEFGPRSGELEQLVSRCPAIQSLSLKLPETGMNLNDAGLLALTKGLPHLRILHILYDYSDPEVCLSPGGVLYFAELRGRNLLKLSLPFPSNFTLNHFQDLLASCPNLLETDFVFKKQETDSTMSSALDFVLPQTRMKHVTMTNMPNAWVGPFTRSIAANVQTLSLNECVGLTFTQIIKVVNECSSLEDLRLELCCCEGMAMNSEGQVAVGGSSQTVKYLSLQFCDSREVDLEANIMARKVLELCPRVRKMEFVQGRDFSPVALLLDRLPCLEELELYCCSMESSSVPSASKGNKGFPHLNSINFKRCTSVSDSLLADMAELSPRLSHLFVDSIHGYVPTFRGLRRLLGRVETKKCPLTILRK